VELGLFVAQVDSVITPGVIFGVELHKPPATWNGGCAAKGCSLAPRDRKGCAKQPDTFSAGGKERHHLSFSL
jgi:hypothetical protein